MSSANRAFAVAMALCAVAGVPALAQDSPPLVREAVIALGSVSGRIDHLAIDLARKHLFVAELGNDSVGVVDLTTAQVLRTLTGLSEPQGVGYVPSTDQLYVANGGDGSVRIFGGADLAPVGRLELGRDADNVRVIGDPARVLVGYGSGGLAVIDPATPAKIADIKLKAHPEGFQLIPGTNRVAINEPDAQGIAVVDLKNVQQTTFWPLNDVHSNYPMAIEESTGTAWVVTRSPARLIGLDPLTGARKAMLETCADSDDVFEDSKRNRIYVSCGAGYIDVWEKRTGGYLQIGHLATQAGARTALFVASLDRLYLAVRATPTSPAAIWVYRPSMLSGPPAGSSPPSNVTR